MSPLVGTQLSGRYRLDAQIGAGGMSTVYRAFDTTLERTARCGVVAGQPAPPPNLGRMGLRSPQ